MALIINNKKYYTVSEVAKISDVHPKTLRRWISKGELDHFLFGYKGEKTPLLFRLEPPCDSDELLDKSKGLYMLPKEIEEDSIKSNS